MADLSLIFPPRRPVKAAGVVWEVEQFRLRDLATLESLLVGPDPLAGRRGEVIAALAGCDGDCLEQTEAGRDARRLLHGLFRPCLDWAPTLSSPAARAKLRELEGMIAFVWVLLGRGRDGFDASAALKVLEAIDGPEEWQALRSAAYGIDPIEEWADWVCPDPAGKPPRTWCESIVSLMGEPPDPSRLEAIGDLYISQWRIIADGGKLRPGEARGEKMEVREINRRKRIVLAEPSGNGHGYPSI